MVANRDRKQRAFGESYSSPCTGDQVHHHVDEDAY